MGFFSQMKNWLNIQPKHIDSTEEEKFNYNEIGKNVNRTAIRRIRIWTACFLITESWKLEAESFGCPASAR